MKRRISAFAIPILVLGTFAWVYAQTAPATAPADTAGGEKVVTKSGLTIITLQKGAGAQTGDTVILLYTGKLTDGTVFDASSLHNNEPIKVT
ncbi:MAG: FKBP-type peptidyl-prolyl cis-trans isomerase, partial [Anaerolineae bacterium]|nr:FKBP-type peptidyl-prolyl cis-trans isomerase [Phycisphaerae bacterium]